MSNGLSIQIKSQEEAIRFAKENPEEALGLTLWNHIELKRNHAELKEGLKQQCDCRRKECDGIYVSKQWVKERKFLVIGVFLGMCLVTGSASAGVMKLLGLL